MMSTKVASPSSLQDGQRKNNPLPSSITVHTKKVARLESAKKRRKEAESRAVKVQAEKAEQAYDLWKTIKQEDRKDKQKFYEGKIILQQTLIKKQDELYQKHRKQIEAKTNQLKEAKRLTKLSKEKHMEEIARRSIADDKAKKLKLKSHYRIISSHEPRKDYHEQEESPSRELEELASNYSDETSPYGSPQEIEQTFIDEDLTELIDAPLNIQLEKILGIKEAEEVLKPSFREGANRTLNPLLIRKKGKGVGADEVWNTLRSQSRQKLLSEDSLILPDIKNAYAAFVRECLRRHVTPVQRSFTNDEKIPLVDQLSESQLLGDVRFMRHRLDLMHRVAHMNKDKTKMLLHSIDPPDFNDSKGKDGLRRYIPDEELYHYQSSVQIIPELSLYDTEGKLVPVSFTRTTEPSSGRESTSLSYRRQKQPEPVFLNGEKITFLTEDMARCEGQFSKRQKEKGSASEVALVDSPRVKSSTYSSMSCPVMPSPSTPSEEKESVKVEKSQSWEPLTFRALTEYQHTVKLFGDGGYSQGVPKKWKAAQS